MQFCAAEQSDAFETSVNKVLNFLQSLVRQNLSYSAINTAKSALSSLFALGSNDFQTIGNHPLIQRFIKGVFVKKPVLPKNVKIWNVSPVLDKLRTMEPLEQLSLKELTLKTVMLLSLLTGHRGQTIHLLKLCDVQFLSQAVKISHSSLLKTSRPKHHLESVIIHEYLPDKSLCLFRVMKYYVEKTQSLRSGDRFFISIVKPHGDVSRDTVSRWTKNIMKICGIDVTIFKSHSTRAASTSAAKAAGVSVADIMRNTGWTNEQTFHKFYSKVIDQKHTDDSYANSILSVCSNI